MDKDERVVLQEIHEEVEGGEKYLLKVCDWQGIASYRSSPDGGTTSKKHEAYRFDTPEEALESRLEGRPATVRSSWWSYSVVPVQEEATRKVAYRLVVRARSGGRKVLVVEDAEGRWIWSILGIDVDEDEDGVERFNIDASLAVGVTHGGQNSFTNGFTSRGRIILNPPHLLNLWHPYLQWRDYYPSRS